LPPLSESPWPRAVASVESPASRDRLKSPQDDQATTLLMPIASTGTQEKDTVGLGLGSTTDLNSHTFGKFNSSTTLRDLRRAPLRPPTRNKSLVLHGRDTPQPVGRSASWSLNPSPARTSESVVSKEEAVDEFGVQRSGSSPSESKDMYLANTCIERSGSTATDRGVALMYTQDANIVTSPPMDALHGVSESVTRYQLVDGDSSPHRRVASPMGERQPQSFDVVPPRPSISQRNYQPDLPSPSSEADVRELTPPRGQEVGRQELTEQANKDRSKEMEIRELEEDSALSVTSRGSPEQYNDGTEPQLQVESPMPIISRKRFAYSATQLFSPTSPTSPTSPPPPSSFTLHPYAQSQSSSAASLAQVSKVDHAAFCSCTTCSASKYEVRAATPTPYDLRPTSPISLRPEKRKGWMHRITIPVGNVFMLDAKKSSHAQGLGFRE
jgi:hypothetical protein